MIEQFIMHDGDDVLYISLGGDPVHFYVESEGKCSPNNQ